MRYEFHFQIKLVFDRLNVQNNIKYVNRALILYVPDLQDYCLNFVYKYLLPCIIDSSVIRIKAIYGIVLSR